MKSKETARSTDDPTLHMMESGRISSQSSRKKSIDAPRFHMEL